MTGREVVGFPGSLKTMQDIVSPSSYLLAPRRARCNCWRTDKEFRIAAGTEQIHLDDDSSTEYVAIAIEETACQLSLFEVSRAYD